MKSLLLSVLLVFPSCYTDATHAIAAKKDQTQIFLEVSENFAQVIKNASGITESQRQLLLAKIKEAVSSYQLSDDPQIEFMKSVDSKNNDNLFAEIQALFDAFRSKI